MELIKTKDLSKVYISGETETKALRGVSLVIENGEFSAITGPSGSGKTTLFNLIGALDSPTSGKIFFNGKDLSNLNKRERTLFRREKIGFVFQTFNLIPVLTALENVAFPLNLLGVPEKEIKKKVYKLLGKVGLKGMEKRKPAALSGGQQQRVAVARALIKDPVLVLADEPTANLDSATGGEIMKLMRKLNKEEGITFLFATHDPMVMEYSTRRIKLRDGKIQE
ncbi:ABC transporter ATP-binding protein [candidate division WOR-3 bacterium]|nr:ABC transporter ATP-binding protein [candidate division WOR-3 bacterium]